MGIKIPIWRETCTSQGVWVRTGGKPSFTLRQPNIDVCLMSLLNILIRYTSTIATMNDGAFCLIIAMFSLEWKYFV